MFPPRNPRLELTATPDTVSVALEATASIRDLPAFPDSQTDSRPIEDFPFLLVASGPVLCGHSLGIAPSLVQPKTSFILPQHLPTP